LHGANRLGGNSLSDILVFGKRAGDAAAAFAKDAGHGNIDEAQIADAAAALLSPMESKGSENPYAITKELQESMQADAMIAKTEEGLTRALNKVLELQGRAKNVKVDSTRAFNPGWHAAWDIQYMLKTSEIIVRCALERKESRGAQWRTDFPDKDPAWATKNLIAKKDGDKVALSTQELEPMPADLQALFDDH